MYAILSAASAIFVQALERRIPDFELNGARFLCGFLVCLLICVKKGMNPVVNLKTKGIPVGIVSICNILTVLAEYTSVSLIPLVTSQTLKDSTKLIFGWFIFWIFVSGAPKALETFCVALILIGGVFVLQPDFLFANKMQEKYKTNSNSTELFSENTPNFSTFLGSALAILAGMFSVTRIFTVKKFLDLFYSESNRWSTVLWTCFSGATLSFAITGFVEKAVIPETIQDTGFFLGHIGAFLFMPGLYFYGCTFVDGNMTIIVVSSVTVYLVIAQYTFMKNFFPGHKNWMEVFGAMLVFLSCVLVPTVTLIGEKKQTEQTSLKRKQTSSCEEEILLKDTPNDS